MPVVLHLMDDKMGPGPLVQFQHGEIEFTREESDRAVCELAEVV